MDTPEIFISYTWRDESLTITEQLDTFLQAQGITVVRDNRDIGYKGQIKDYMQRLGKGKYVVIVLSDQYFKSKSCMFELMQIAEHGEMYDRIFPIAAPGTEFYEAENLLEFVNYWDEKIAKLDTLIKQSQSSAKLQGIREDLDLYVDIRHNIARLLDFLRNINTHPLRNSNFEPLLQAIRAKLVREQDGAVSPTGEIRTEVKTPKITMELRRQIIDFFMSLPNIYDPNTPRALIQSADLDPQLLGQIHFGGPPVQFFQLLLPTLMQYGRLQDGRHALQAVLEAAQYYLAGNDEKITCDNLIRALG